MEAEEYAVLKAEIKAQLIEIENIYAKIAKRKSGRGLASLVVPPTGTCPMTKGLGNRGGDMAMLYLYGIYKLINLYVSVFVSLFSFLNYSRCCLLSIKTLLPPELSFNFRFIFRILGKRTGLGGFQVNGLSTSTFFNEPFFYYGVS